MKQPIISVKDLCFLYSDEDFALKKINIDIFKGEKIAVIGSNGAGKSTFFLNLNGVLKPEKGEILYNGITTCKENSKQLRKNIGVVFQDADSQIIASTVKGEVSFGPMNLKLPKEEVIVRVNEALEYMNITEYKDRPPHFLSGGEKKRVTIADIIAMKSEVIIFDEPLASLDPLNVIMLENVLEKLASELKTLIISTHDIDFVYRWAQRVVVFCKGEIIADGKPMDVFENQEVLEKASLKKPTMLEVFEILLEKNILGDLNSFPKSPDELKKLFI